MLPPNDDLPGLAAFFISHLSGDEAGSASGRLCAVFARTPLRKWMRYSRLVRGWTGVVVGKPEFDAARRSLDAFPHDAQGIRCLGILSWAADGYLREAALRQLETIGTGDELPFLLIALRDHVPQVSAVAKRAVEDRLTEEYAPVWVRNLELVDQLQKLRKVALTTLFARIDALLRSRAGTKAIKSFALQVPVSHRRLGYLRILENQSVSNSVLRQALRAADDPMIRVRAVEALARLHGEKAKSELLTLLVRDPAVQVKRRIIDLLNTRWPVEARDAMQWCLVHRSKLMRSTAKRILGLLREQAAQHYRTRLRDPSKLVLISCIYGLGENGTRPDAALIEPFTRDIETRVRKAAYTALAALDGDAYGDVLLRATGDHSIAVAKGAAKALRLHAKDLSADVLWETFAGSRPAVRRIMLYGMPIKKWDWLEFLLMGLKQPFDPKEANNTKEQLKRWILRFHRSSDELDDAQRVRIEGVLEECSTSLSADMLEELRVLMR